MAAAIVTAVTIVLNNRTPVKTIAWVLVILTIPFFGLLIYFIFGRDNRRRRLIGRKFLTQIQKRALHTYIRSNETLTIPDEYIRIVKFFENVADAYPVNKNRIEIINEGSTFLIRLLQEIKKVLLFLN
jgi:cardiolipin synthase